MSTATPTLIIPGITDLSTIARIARARNFDYYKRMVNDALAGHCPFCKVDRKQNKIVQETDLWFIWHCNPPEKNTRLHLLMVPKRHVKSIADLDQAEFISIQDGYKLIRQQFELTSAGIQIRDGDATLLAGTQEHLHLHFMVPDGKGRVESPLAKELESEVLGVRRAIAYEKLRTGARLGELDAEELELIHGRI